MANESIIMTEKNIIMARETIIMASETIFMADETIIMAKESIKLRSTIHYIDSFHKRIGGTRRPNTKQNRRIAPLFPKKPVSSDAEILTINEV
jgi:hypothetical protein